MSELTTPARPYARAAFESAQGAGALADWSVFLARTAATVSDARIQALIGNPRVRAAELVELLVELGAATGSSAGARQRESQRNFMALLAHNQRLRLLPEILVQYEILRAEAERIADVEVASARELSDEQAHRLQGALERRLGRRVRLHARVDTGLLGGAIVRYGDYVIDGSLRRRVERLGTVLTGA